MAAPAQSRPPNSAFAADVLAGLSEAQKTVPCRWLYDEHGSALFEQITALPEYYVTRTETAILRTHARDIAACIEPGSILVEYGAGASVKTRILIDALEDLAGYVPVDISGAFLAEAALRLAAAYPELEITPIAGDFMKAIDFDLRPGMARPRTGFFPGSTIGNLSDAEIISFLRTARASLGRNAQLILGADLIKSPAILRPAYDDAAGVTAAFNLNLLVRINRELAGNFALRNFTHEARWNAAEGRIEMHLVSLTGQTAEVMGQPFAFAEGETIHTENSRKFDAPALERLAHSAGWQLTRTWLDDNRFFCVALLQ